MPAASAALVGISHGPSSPEGQSAIAGLMAAVGGAQPTLHTVSGFVEVRQPDVAHAIAALGSLGVSARPSLFRRSTIACTDLEFCKLANVDTKQTATDAVLELETRLAALDLPQPISLHVNGCPNSCARIQTADIGLKGQLLPDGDGGQTPGFQVQLGGGLVSDTRDEDTRDEDTRAEAGLGRTVRGLKVTADGLGARVERLVRRFLADRTTDETFAAWAHPAEEEALR